MQESIQHFTELVLPLLTAVSTYLLANPLIIGSGIAAIVTVTVARITLSGVRQTLAGNADRQKEDIAHKVSEGHVARITAARREIYLSAVDELVKAQVYYGSLAKLNIAEIDPMSSLSGFLAAVAKVTLISDLDTAEKARDVANKFTIGYLRAIAYLSPNAHLHSKRSMHEKESEKAQKEITELLIAMKEYNLRGDNDIEAFRRLQRECDAQLEISDKAFEKLKETMQELSQLQFSYSEFIKSDIEIMTEGMDELAMLMRGELGISVDLPRWREQTQRLRIELNTTLREFLTELLRKQSEEKLHQPA
ncbi:hypothetical protein J2X19_003633 [Rhodoferax ferrireducens]|uniref:Uncharacterized protein n=1 Tax=Rhodoferax ferrireducens TaxID=192843 RepID=A0ABU2CC87_9BURK|nr:hypothetical protein [Rhodoferax ferrireducens]MDR7378939.1 hypothetical protein [Rhodoferax ferrireducens]